MIKISYNTQVFPFAERLCQALEVEDLSFVNDTVELFSREKDQNTVYHKKYYDWSRTDEFIQLYDNFVKMVIKPLYSEQIVYQAIPTFRVAYPDNIAVGEFHKDKFYRDINWATDVDEDNFYLPFTNTFDTNTIWVESKEDKGDFAPMECTYGELIQWDGSNLMHGNKINKTGKTRISVDFRVMTYTNYRPSEYGSINTKTKFQIGGYYKTV
jgi:ectoine hydroxylase-related dioxygenase (phytanoyl-CoA dioxygenase family)